MTRRTVVGGLLATLPRPPRASAQPNRVDQVVRAEMDERHIPGGWTPSRSRTTTMGAGGIQSHVFDLARWDAALAADRILTAESKRAMWAPFRLTDGRWHPYGFAWAIRERLGGLGGARSPPIHQSGRLPSV
jgi:CubicO group peptidase (beta-lactamase class C family)